MDHMYNATLVFFLALILLARCGSASTPPNLESRFGVSFSPSTIIVSRFNASGLIELTKFPASSAYQQYYREAVQNSDLDHDIDEINAKSIFRNSIQPITETLSKQLGHAPEYASLFVPSIFDYRTRLAAREVIFQKPQYATRAAPSQTAACWPYSFLQSKNLGRPAHECNDDGLDNIIFLLEYEEEYIYAWLLLVEYELGGYPVTHEKICKDCGERHREELGERAYQERVKQFVYGFIAANVPLHQREEVRAVIVTGEASKAATTDLGNLAVNAVGTEVVKLMTDIDPAEVVAHGAAVWARMTQQRPEEFQTHDGNITPNDEEWASMLENRRLVEHSEL